jgi:hypothetical protein
MGDYADYFIDGPGIDRTVPLWNSRGKTKGKKTVTFTLNAAQAASYKAIGGAAAVRKLIENEAARAALSQGDVSGEGEGS